MGTRFAKWRVVFAIGDGIPSRRCIEADTHALARYAFSLSSAGTTNQRDASVCFQYFLS